MRPCPELATASVIVAAHERAGQDQHARAREPGDGPHGAGQRLLADQRNGVDRDALAADVVAIGLADGADGHLADLRAATHDDDALAVDLHQRWRFVDPLDHRQRRQRVTEAREVLGGVYLEIDAKGVAASPEALDRADVRRMSGDDAR